MNRNQFKLGGFIIILLFILNSCNDSSEETDPCLNGPQLTVNNALASIEGKSTGEITVSVTGGKSPYMYSLDGTTFQSSETFTGLSGDNYTVTVKDANDCTDTEIATVNEISEVFYGNQIMPIINANCQIPSCHGSNSGIPTWATYNDVKAKAGRIKDRTGAKSMPPTGPLSDTDIKLIADWVDIGAPNN